MNEFLSKAALDFLIAFGIVMGGSLIASIGSTFMLLPPATIMLETASRLKIWAIVAAIGGSVDPVRVIESNITAGQLSPAIQQICFIVFAFLGAHLASELIKMMCRGAV